MLDTGFLAWTISISMTVNRELFTSGNFGENDARKVFYFFPQVFISPFKGFLMEIFSRVYFLLCLFSGISGQSRTQGK